MYNQKGSTADPPAIPAFLRRIAGWGPERSRRGASGGFDGQPAKGRSRDATSPDDRQPRPIRVLVINDHLGYTGGVIHGVTTYFATLSGFDRRQVEPCLCILGPRHPAAERFEAIGISPIFLGRSKWDPRALVDLVRVVREQEIDVLHLSGMKGMVLGRIAARITGRPAIVHFHDTTRVSFWLRFLQRRVVPGATYALAVSEAVRRFVIEDFGIPSSRIEVLHYGMDIDGMAASGPDAGPRIRREHGLDQDAPVITVMGRLIPEKGHEQLIRAMPMVLAACPAAVLVIVGDGPSRRDCERLVGALGLGAAVRFLGYRSDVPDLLAAADVAVVPSLWVEGFGYVALEAMCAGLPVVASRVGGLPEVVVHGETGLLVPAGDSEALAEALVQVLRDPDLRRSLGDAGRRRARLFTVERHCARMTRVYARAVERGWAPSSGADHRAVTGG